MIFEILQGIPMCKAVAASMADMFPERISPIIPKKINIIKYQLCGTYQFAMDLHRQFQWFCAAKSNTPDQEQVNIKQTNAC